MIKQVCAGLSVFLLLLPGVFGQKKILPVNEFEKQLSQKEAQLLDVRTSEEYSAGHIRNSLHADWLKRDQFVETVQHLEKNQALYVYCGSGVRSSDAAKWMRSNGFRNVFELENGFISWKKNNKEIEADSAVSQMPMSEYLNLINSSPVLLIDFGAKWCPPCKKVAPVLQQLQNELNEKFTLVNIDGGVHTEIMKNLRVEKLPTFIVYRQGKEIWRKQGLVSTEEFKSVIQ
jgi:rhodanese-related sulfurtransferase